MIEWKDKVETRKVEDIKISTDGKYELQIFSEEKKYLPYFFISKKVQGLLLGYGYGKTQLESMKDCLKNMEKSIQYIKNIANELSENIVEMEKAEQPTTAVSYAQMVGRADRGQNNPIPPELSLTDEQIRSGEFQ